MSSRNQFSKLTKINAVSLYLLEQNSAARRSSTVGLPDGVVRVATTVKASFSPGTREVNVAVALDVTSVCGDDSSEGWKVERRFVTGLLLVSETSRSNCVVWTFDWARASETKFIRSYYVSLFEQDLVLKYLLYTFLLEVRLEQLAKNFHFIKNFSFPSTRCGKWLVEFLDFVVIRCKECRLFFCYSWVIEVLSTIYFQRE